MLLFDIDNTLLRNSRSHPQAFRIGFSRVFGVEGKVESINHHGMTDLQILWEVLTHEGVPEHEIRDRQQKCLQVIADAFSELIGEEELIVLDGVRELLMELSRGTFALGLVTGNLESIAWQKLDRAGLAHFFSFGGFGSDDSIRSNLVRAAVKRAEALGIAPTDGQVVLIGDTPRDVSAGQEAGVRTIAVATGLYSEDALARAGADAVLGSFKPIDSFLSLLKRMGIHA
jgi:phosphoglycolate phosphatase